MKKRYVKFLLLLLVLPFLMGGTIQVGTGPTKTTGAVSRTIGATGDYTTFAAALASVPNLLEHSVVFTIQAGTTITTGAIIQRFTSTGGALALVAEKYYPPASTVIPTADSATATALRDATLATAAYGDDYFNGCWILIVDGAGTNNGFVPITDYVDAAGDVVVASWPGTQPDNTSHYIIVGALIDCNDIENYGIYAIQNNCPIYVRGLGIKSAANHGMYFASSLQDVGIYSCGVYDSYRNGIYIYSSPGPVFIYYCGLVGNNTANDSIRGGIAVSSNPGFAFIGYSGISDNLRQGNFSEYGCHLRIVSNFGDNNGTWGTYVTSGSIATCQGTECSGSSGNHSNGSGDGSLAY